MKILVLYEITNLAFSKCDSIYGTMLCNFGSVGEDVWDSEYFLDAEMQTEEWMASLAS